MGSHHSHEAHMAKVSKESVTLDEWKNMCASLHANFYSQLGDRIWDVFKYPSQDMYILQKIAIPLFGKPMKENFKLDITDEQKALVLEIRDKCVKHSLNKWRIHLSVIFAFVYVNETYQTIFPIIRVMSSAGETLQDIPNNIFIDHLGRVYDDWTKYTNENTLNKAWICVPKNGYYGSKSDYEFLDQSSQGEVLDAIDHYSTYANIATGLTMLGGIILTFFPVTAPIGAVVILGSNIAGAPSAIYGVGRGVEELSDRYNHEQSLSLADYGARHYWLLTALSLLSVGPMAAENILAEGVEAGLVTSSVTHATVTTMNITTSTVAGLGIINSIYELSEKKNVSTLDVLELMSSIFFFSHSLMTLRTANSVIGEVQKNQLSKTRENLIPEQQAIHDALSQGSKEIVEYGQISEIHGEAKFMREMKTISNVEEFYSRFDIKNDKQLLINSQLTVHPKAFMDISESDRSKILSSSKQLRTNGVSLKEFNSELRPIQKECRLRLERHRTEAENYLKNKFKVSNLSDIRVGNKRLGNFRPEDVDKLEEVVKHSFHNGNEELMKLANRLSVKRGVSNVTEYCAIGEYAARQVDIEVAKRQKAEPNPTKEKDVQSNEYCMTRVITELIKNENWLNAVVNQSGKLQNEINTVNTRHSRFNKSIAAAKHYDKQCFIPKKDPANNLSSEMYFNIATKMVGGPISNVTWTQDGSCLKCTFDSEKYGATAIQYDNLANHISVIATLTAENVKDSIFINPV